MSIAHEPFAARLRTPSFGQVRHRPHPRGRLEFPSSRLRNKNRLDRVLATIGLVISAPLLVLLWLLVRMTSRGPGVYSQLRIGYQGRLYHLYKFRSMYHNCEQSTGAVWAARNDSRVTWMGKILRATYLDELPQLVNVIKGEMSLVGPRPERPEIAARLRREFPRHYYQRLMVKPGITGLAQIRQASDTNVADVRRKLRYDLLYVRRAGIWLDLKLMAGTLLGLIGVLRKR